MNKIKKIVLATDFSECAKIAHRLAKEIQDKLKCKLEILHIFDIHVLDAPAPAPYDYVPDWIEDYVEENKKRGQKALEQLGKELKADKTHFIEGVPHQKIVDFTDNTRTNLLIIGTHGYSGVKRLLAGSVAEYVTRYAKCPVLTAKNGVK